MTNFKLETFFYVVHSVNFTVAVPGEGTKPPLVEKICSFLAKYRENE